MNFKELSDEEKKKLREMFRAIEKNEDDYHNLPHYGFVADWFIRYWNMHNMVLEFFGQEPYDEPLENRKAYDESQRKEM